MYQEKLYGTIYNAIIFYMLDLYGEFKSLVKEFQAEGLDYALCGGLAMAVYAAPRATVDIDILVENNSLSRVEEAAKRCGFEIKALPMIFKNGNVVINRLSKIEQKSGDILSLDILIVTSEIEQVWLSREEMKWEGGKFWVVSREGLVKLKSLRGSLQDLSDIKALKEAGDKIGNDS